jgi:hypothetical protein
MYRRLLLGLVALTLTSCVTLPGSNTSKTSSPAHPATTTTTTPTPTTPVASPDGSATTTGCLSETTDAYQRPFAAVAPWNVPVCGLTQDPRSADWANRFYYYSHYNKYMGGDPSQATDSTLHTVMFGLDANPVNDFSVAVYDAKDATTTARVFQRSGWDGAMNTGNGATIPWNPTWRASTGSDALLTIIDHTTGHEWTLWGLVQSTYSLPLNDTQCWGWIPYGYQRGTDLCVGSADMSKNAAGTTPINTNTYAGNNPATRGSGIDEYALLATPQEASTGQIRHALAMPVFNTMNGGPGQICTQTQMNTTAFGSTCGNAVAPAGQFESGSVGGHGCGNNPPAAALTDTTYRQTTIPEGTRFALHMTDQDIETWLNTRGYTGQKRVTAKAFAVALVNYGWFITDTSCYSADFQVSGSANPQTAAAWRADGITGDGRDLLQGLITKTNVWTITPPTNHCNNGTTTKAACPADTITYP